MRLIRRRKFEAADIMLKYRPYEDYEDNLGTDDIKVVDSSLSLVIDRLVRQIMRPEEFALNKDEWFDCLDEGMFFDSFDREDDEWERRGAVKVGKVECDETCSHWRLQVSSYPSTFSGKWLYWTYNTLTGSSKLEDKESWIKAIKDGIEQDS